MEDAAGARHDDQQHRGGQRSGLVGLFLCLGIVLLASESGLQFASDHMTSLGASLGIVEVSDTIEEPHHPNKRSVDRATKHLDIDGENRLTVSLQKVNAASLQ